MATVKSLEAALHSVIDHLQINDTHKQELHEAVSGNSTDSAETTEGAEDDGRERD